MKIKQNKITLLPKQIVEEIKSLKLTSIQEKKCYQLISIIRNKSNDENKNFYSFVELPSSYLKTILSKKYKTTVDYLLNNNIIVCDNIYKFNLNSNTKGKSLCYKINNRFITDLCSISNYVTVSYNRELFKANVDYNWVRRSFITDIESLEINTKKLKEMTKERMDNLSISNFRTNEDIEDNNFKVCLKNDNFEMNYWSSTENAIKKAKEKGLTLIQDKSRYYIMDANVFINMKRDYILASYSDSINKIDKRYWYASTNPTNNRLDTNITNLCGELMNEITESNDLVSLDLCNSQFAILSHILPADVTGDDVRLFKALSYSGELYTYMQEEIGLESRKEAKQMTIELLFSNKTNGDKINSLKSIFPNVVEWINKYKKENSASDLAIMLQREESKMFIQDIWRE
ncbi:MAG: Unknown protein, partial [uncultured Sulfurovum sp.]